MLPRRRRNKGKVPPPERIDRTLIVGDYRTTNRILDAQLIGGPPNKNGKNGDYGVSQYSRYFDPGLTTQLSLEQLKKLSFMPESVFENLDENEPDYGERLRQLNAMAQAYGSLNQNNPVTMVGIDKDFREAIANDENWQKHLQNGNLNIGGNIEQNDSDFYRILGQDGAIKPGTIDDYAKTKEPRTYPDHQRYSASPQHAEAYYQLYVKGISQDELLNQYGLDIDELSKTALHDQSGVVDYGGDHKHDEVLRSRMQWDGMQVNSYGKYGPLVSWASEDPDFVKQGLTQRNPGDKIKHWTQQKIDDGVVPQLRSDLDKANDFNSSQILDMRLQAMTNYSKEFGQHAQHMKAPDVSQKVIEDVQRKQELAEQRSQQRQKRKPPPAPPRRKPPPPPPRNKREKPKAPPRDHENPNLGKSRRRAPLPPPRNDMDL